MKIIVILLVLITAGCKSSNINIDREVEFTSLKKALKTPYQVRHLNLSDRKLKQIPEEIYGFSNLLSLNLSGNEISVIPKDLIVLTSLERLDLSQNQIEIIPSYISALKNLKVLQMSENKVSSLPTEMGDMVNLRKLILIYNELDESDVEELRKKLPDCEIAVSVIK